LAPPAWTSFPIPTWRRLRDAAATAPLKAHKLRGDVAVIEGSGIAVLIGPDGKVFIDAGITATRPRSMDTINSLGRDPFKHLINTHRHFDHTDGNQWLNAEGAAILAHENTYKTSFIRAAGRRLGVQLSFLAASGSSDRSLLI
jgi:glyoxylase-like metal-dependent hydrolase (beta-lactamase superfamily II)